MRGFGSLAGTETFLQDVEDRRREDVIEQDSYNEKFLLARKVTKVPTSTTDVTATDRVDDFNWDENFIYILMDVSGPAIEWRTFPTTTFNGNAKLNISTKTADYTIISADDVILADGTSNTVDITLPTAVGIAGRIYHTKAINITNAVTLKTTSSQTIDGVTSQTPSLNANIMVISDNSNWRIL